MSGFAKKALLLTACPILSVLVGCSGTTVAEDTSAKNPQNTTAAATPQPTLPSGTVTNAPAGPADQQLALPTPTGTLAVPNPAQELMKSGQVSPGTHHLTINEQADSSAMFLAIGNPVAGETIVTMNCAKETDVALRILPQDKQLTFPDNRCVPGKPVVIKVGNLPQPVATLEVDLPTMLPYAVGVFVKK